MALARVRRGESGMNYWPGFVDALSTLILGIIFLLTVFVVVQFYLRRKWPAKTPRCRAQRANRPTHDCSRWKNPANPTSKSQLAPLRATLAIAEGERDS